MATDLDHLLAEHGYRSTAPRRAVWKALAEAQDHDGPTHATVDQLTERIHRSDASVNVASVYRSLALFRELGLVRESRLGDDSSRWELAHPDDQFHMVCGGCGGVEHHAGSVVDEIAKHLLAGHGFATSSVDLVVHGQCASCSGNAPDPNHQHASHDHSHGHSH